MPGKTPPIEVSATSLQLLWDESIAWLIGHFLQIAIAGSVGAMLVAAMIGLRAGGNRMCRRYVSVTHWPQTVGRVIAETRLWFMVLLAAKLVQSYADPPLIVLQTVNVLFTIAAAMQGALWMRALIFGLVEHRAGDDGHTAVGSAMGIIRLLVTVILYAITAVLILDNLGVNVTGLVAGPALAASLSVSPPRAFSTISFRHCRSSSTSRSARGDSIRWDKTSGTVEAIGLKTTRVRAVTGEEVVISNTNLLNKELHNMARLNRRRIEFPLKLIYQTPPEALARVPELVAAVVGAEDKCVLIRCGIVGFSPPSIDVEVQFDVRSEDWNEVFATRHRVAIAILEAFVDAGIEFAAPDGKAITPPVVPPPEGSAGTNGKPGA
jgi:small-conductance mechanosensitive channel